MLIKGGSVDKDKMQINNVKQKFNGLRQYLKSHVLEALTVFSVALAVFSASSDIFMGSWGWSGLFLLIGVAAGVFMPAKADEIMKKIYAYSKQQSATANMAAEGVKAGVALFVPFIYFCFLGAMAGTAFQYYLKNNVK